MDSDFEFTDLVKMTSSSENVDGFLNNRRTGNILTRIAPDAINWGKSWDFPTKRSLILSMDAKKIAARFAADGYFGWP
ncbi:MAG: hypothetical protein JST51_14240 [Armatimonadetes bacterium]|nr:hypothetical protein [Armatimonadota bacterium]